MGGKHRILLLMDLGDLAGLDGRAVALGRLAAELPVAVGRDATLGLGRLLGGCRRDREERHNGEIENEGVSQDAHSKCPISVSSAR